MEYVSVIKDECEQIVCFAAGYKETEIEEMLEQHPEWYRSVVEV